MNLAKIKQLTMEQFQTVFSNCSNNTYRLVQSSVSTLLQKSQTILPFIKETVVSANQSIAQRIKGKEVILASSAIGIATLYALFKGARCLFGGKQKQGSQQSKKQNQNLRKLSSDSTQADQNSKQRRIHCGINLQNILEISEDESTESYSNNRDKIFFEVYQAYLQEDE